MSSETRTVLAVVAVASIVVLVVVLVIAALRPGTTEVTVLPPVDLPPPGELGPSGEPIAIVVSTREDQETSLFGFIKRDTHYIVDVQFYVPAECVSAVTDGDPWPSSTSGCSSDVAIEGVVSGTGVAPTGDGIVLVSTEVTEACFARVSPGGLWPIEDSHCP